MKILAIGKDLKPIPAEDRKKLLAAEARRVWDLEMSSVIREIHMTENRTRAIIILECGNVKEAETHLGTLPLAAEGYIGFDVYELEPYPGIERLFGGRSEGSRP